MGQKLTDERESLNVLYYGDGGTGKTTHLATMANLGPILIINAESGVKKRALDRMGIDTSNIEIFPGEGEELTYDSLEGEWLRVREALHADPDAYVGVGMDSITEVQMTMTEQNVAESVRKATARGQERNPFVISQDNRTEANAQMRSLIRKFRDLPCHFAVTALMRREQDNDSTITYQPGVTPALQNDLVGWMDTIVVTSVADFPDLGVEQYRGLFRPSGKHRGKDRFKIIPKWLVDPTFERILQYVEEELDVDSDPVMKEAKKLADKAKRQDDAASSAKDKSTDEEE